MNRFKSTTNPLMWIMALLLAAVVAGCGGGSSSSGGTPAIASQIMSPYGSIKIFFSICAPTHGAS